MAALKGSIEEAVLKRRYRGGGIEEAASTIIMIISVVIIIVITIIIITIIIIIYHYDLTMVADLVFIVVFGTAIARAIHSTTSRADPTSANPFQPRLWKPGGAARKRR